MLNEYVKSLELQQLQQSSINSYKKAIHELLTEYGDIPTIEQINDFIIRKCHKRQAWVKYAIKHYLKHVGRESDYKLLTKAKVRKPIKQRNFLTRDEMEVIVENMKNEKYKLVATIQKSTGARAAEILSFDKYRTKKYTYKDKDNKEVQAIKITIKGKGDKPGNIFLSISLWDKLQPYYSKCRRYPFLADAEPIPYLSFWKVVENEYKKYWECLREAGKEMNMDIGTHDLRRSFAQIIRESTNDIFKVMNTLRHSNIKTTLRYFDDKETEVADTMLEYQKGI